MAAGGGIEIVPAGGGGDIDFGSRGQEELWASRGGKGGDRAKKVVKMGPKMELLEAKKFLHISK